MIVIIDGYNLLHAIFPAARGKELPKDHFIRQLGHYHELRRATIDEIIIVFDAGPFGHATREVHHGVVVMHSGQKSNADHWIVEYVERYRGKELIVISKDRQLVKLCEAAGALSLGVEEFYQLMKAALLAEGEQLADFGLSSEIEKFDDNGDEELYGGLSKRALDMLMEEGSMGVKPKTEADSPSVKEKGKGHRPSKDEKKWIKIVKKL